MPRQELELAKELIDEKAYDKAMMLLRRIPDDPTARRWIDKLNGLMQTPTVPETEAAADPADLLPASDAAWQYMALEVKRSYGIQYKTNGEMRPEWKDQPIYYPLNLLGQEGWELVMFESQNEVTVYLLKRRGAASVSKIDVWDQ